MRAYGVGHADAAFIVAPGDDVLPHPSPLDEPGLDQVRPAGDEVPALGKGEGNGAFSIRVRRVVIDQDSAVSRSHSSTLCIRLGSIALTERCCLTKIFHVVCPNTVKDYEILNRVIILTKRSLVKNESHRASK
jgi:hypothetical protein